LLERRQSPVSAHNWTPKRDCDPLVAWRETASNHEATCDRRHSPGATRRRPGPYPGKVGVKSSVQLHSFTRRSSHAALQPGSECAWIHNGRFPGDGDSLQLRARLVGNASAIESWAQE